MKKHVVGAVVLIAAGILHASIGLYESSAILFSSAWIVFCLGGRKDGE